MRKRVNGKRTSLFVVFLVNQVCLLHASFYAKVILICTYSLYSPSSLCCKSKYLAATKWDTSLFIWISNKFVSWISDRIYLEFDTGCCGTEMLSAGAEINGWATCKSICGPDMLFIQSGWKVRDLIISDKITKSNWSENEGNGQHSVHPHHMIIDEREYVVG